MSLILHHLQHAGSSPAGPQQVMASPPSHPLRGSVEDVFRADDGVHLKVFTGSRRGKRSGRSGRGSRGSARCRAAAGAVADIDVGADAPRHRAQAAAARGHEG
jgi:hypothetical protein